MALALKKDLIYSKLRDRILSGELVGKLPKELEFARSLKVGKVTLRSALDRLQAESLISRIHGRGTFVVPQNERFQSKEALLIIGEDAPPWHSPYNYIIPAAYQYAVEKGYNPEIINSSRIADLSRNEFKALIARRHIIGILYPGSNFNGEEAILENLKLAELPVVLPHAHRKDNKITGFCTMYTDEPLAVDSIIDELVSKGHKKIAFLGMRKTSRSFRGKTLQGVTSLLGKYGCYVCPEYFPQASYDDNIEETITELISLVNPPEALILFSDFFAVKAYRAIHNAGLKIPDDISVMGICGYPDADMVTPHLSTVDFQYSKIAHQAIDMIIKHREWFKPGTPGPVVRSDFKLIERQSINNFAKVSKEKGCRSKSDPALVLHN